MWTIQQKTDPTMFWSNQDGWVSEGFDVFSNREKQLVNLPMDGKWRQSGARSNLNRSQRLPWRMLDQED